MTPLWMFNRLSLCDAMLALCSKEEGNQGTKWDSMAVDNGRSREGSGMRGNVPTSDVPIAQLHFDLSPWPHAHTEDRKEGSGTAENPQLVTGAHNTVIASTVIPGSPRVSNPLQEDVKDRGIMTWSRSLLLEATRRTKAPGDAGVPRGRRPAPERFDIAPRANQCPSMDQPSNAEEGPPPSLSSSFLAVPTPPLLDTWPFHPALEYGRTTRRARGRTPEGLWEPERIRAVAAAASYR